jgi:hypothetical protein
MNETSHRCAGGLWLQEYTARASLLCSIGKIVHCVHYLSAAPRILKTIKTVVFLTHLYLLLIENAKSIIEKPPLNFKSYGLFCICNSQFDWLSLISFFFLIYLNVLPFRLLPIVHSFYCIDSLVSSFIPLLSYHSIFVPSFNLSTSSSSFYHSHAFYLLYRRSNLCGAPGNIALSVIPHVVPN